MPPDTLPRIPAQFLDGAGRSALAGFERALSLAGMRLLSDGRRQVLMDVAQPGDLIESIPLGTGAGFTEAGIAAVTSSDLLVSEGEARRILQDGSRITDIAPLIEASTPWEEIRHALLLQVDPRPGLDLLDRYLGAHADFFVIRATRMFYARALVWRLITRASDEALTWVRAQAEGVRAVSRDPAIAEIRPSVFLSPLVARNQPLATIFETARYAVIVAIPRNGAFRRVSDLGGWPSGAGDSLHGPGVGVYATRYGQIPHELASELFKTLVVGADDLCRMLTSPTHWVDDDREIDTLERNIAWSSVHFGLESLVTIGSTWSSSDRLWGGFRSLGTLEGVWLESIPLRALLHPDTIERVAIAAMPRGFNRDIEEDLVGRWRVELDGSGHGDIAQAVDHVAEARNLVHGAGSWPNRRNVRMAALRELSDANLQLVSDVARVWWTALIAHPALLAPPNRPI